MKTRNTYGRITPADISCKQFPVTFRGLDAEEVYAFLEAIKEDMFELEKEIARLREWKEAVEEALGNAEANG